ncbi:hypothetical protein CHCC20335_1659 [Bacillus paralicheniformis]|nr:hypothetical protein CHCC20335_1659 [Bacillus paralicheniformis]
MLFLYVDIGGFATLLFSKMAKNAPGKPLIGTKKPLTYVW